MFVQSNWFSRNIYMSFHFPSSQWTDSTCYLRYMVTVNTGFQCLFVNRMHLLTGTLPVSKCLLRGTVAVTNHKSPKTGYCSPGQQFSPKFSPKSEVWGCFLVHHKITYTLIGLLLSMDFWRLDHITLYCITVQ